MPKTPLPTTPEEARAYWKTSVARRANSVIRGNSAEEKIEKLTIKVKAACEKNGAKDQAEGLNGATVAAWLSDKSIYVPANAALHQALMDALDLPLPAAASAKKKDNRTNWRKTFAPQAKQDPVAMQLAQLRTQLESAWAESFDDACKQFIDAEEANAAGRGGKAGKGSPHHPMPQRADGNYDSRFLPDRTGDIHTTHNIHEYLLLLRKKFDFSHAEMGELLGISEGTYGEWECGASTPGRESLLALKSKLNGGYEHLVNVLIDNRLSTLRGVLREHTDSWGVASERYKNVASNILSAMPHRYWQEVIDQAHNPHITRTKRHKERPEWAQHVVKVKTQGEYFTAVRHYLGLSADDLGAAMGIDATGILKLEGGHLTLDSGTAQRCIAYVEQRQAEVQQGQIANGIPEAQRDAPFFRRDVLENLPQQHRNSEVHGPHTKRASNAGHANGHNGRA